MRLWIRWGVVVAGFACLVGAAMSSEAQTVYGPSGLFVHPTAFTPHRGSIGLNLSTFNQGSAEEDEGSSWIPLTLTYSPSDTNELGAMYINRVNDNEHHHSGGIFAKHQFMSDSPAHPAFALTGSWFGGEVRQTTFAGVFSHEFKRSGHPFVTLHAGGLWGRSSYEVDEPTSGFGAFTGGEFPLGRGFRLVGEVGSRLAFNTYSAYSYGVMWAGSRGQSVGISYIDAGRSQSPRFFIGVGYPLGGS